MLPSLRCLFGRALLVALGLSGATLGSSRAAAQNVKLVGAQKPRVDTELLGTTPYNRFQLVTRSLLGDGTEITGPTAHLVEVSASLKVADEWAIGAVIPFGMMTAGLVGSDQGLLGNVGVGVSWGKNLPLGDSRAHWISFGVGIDALLPTAPGDSGANAAPSVAAAIRAESPYYYLPAFGALVTRFTISLSMFENLLRATGELRYVNGFLIEESDPYVGLSGGFGELAVRPVQPLEIYARIGVTQQVSGTGSIEPPLTITPGVRFQPTDNLVLGLFAGFNVETSDAFTIGLEVGGLVDSETKRSGWLGDD